jgi:hypothetical protein
MLEQLWLTAGAIVLKPGLNYVEVACLVSFVQVERKTGSLMANREDHNIDAGNRSFVHGLGKAIA